MKFPIEVVLSTYLTVPVDVSKPNLLPKVLELLYFLATGKEDFTDNQQYNAWLAEISFLALSKEYRLQLYDTLADALDQIDGEILEVLTHFSKISKVMLYEMDGKDYNVIQPNGNEWYGVVRNSLYTALSSFWIVRKKQNEILDFDLEIEFQPNKINLEENAIEYCEKVGLDFETQKVSLTQMASVFNNLAETSEEDLDKIAEEMADRILGLDFAGVEQKQKEDEEIIELNDYLTSFINSMEDDFFNGDDS